MRRAQALRTVLLSKDDVGLDERNGQAEVARRNKTRDGVGEIPLSTKRVQVVRSLAELRTTVRSWQRAGEQVGLVPTMGALHAGHIALVKTAKAQAQRAVVSIFVNPTQFAPQEDFSSYPRDEENDLSKLAEVDCDIVWMPDVA